MKNWTYSANSKGGAEVSMSKNHEIMMRNWETRDFTFEALRLINTNSAAFPLKYFPTSTIALAWAKNLLGFVISAFWRLLSLWALLNQTQNQQDYSEGKNKTVQDMLKPYVFLLFIFLHLSYTTKENNFLVQTYVHLVLRHPIQKYRHVPVQ